MAQGLDGFLYDVSADGKTSNYHFWDPDDATNVADVSVSASDLGDNTDARSSAEFAYAKVVKQLTDARSKRLAGAEANRVAAVNEEAKRVRDAQTDFLNNAQEQEIKPVGTEKRDDGVTQNVYNANPPSDNTGKDDKKK